jgi:hypothetical protein
VLRAHPPHRHKEHVRLSWPLMYFVCEHNLSPGLVEFMRSVGRRRSWWNCCVLIRLKLHETEIFCHLYSVLPDWVKVTNAYLFTIVSYYFPSTDIASVWYRPLDTLCSSVKILSEKYDISLRRQYGNPQHLEAFWQLHS